MFYESNAMEEIREIRDEIYEEIKSYEQKRKIKVPERRIRKSRKIFTKQKKGNYLKHGNGSLASWA